MPLSTLQHSMMAFDGGALGFRNRLINADMRIDQRNNGSAATINSTASYIVDRFQAGASGANATAQRIASGVTGVPNALRITGASGVTTVWISQKIEADNCADLQGKTVKISALIALSAGGSVNINLKYANTSNDFTAVTSIGTQVVSVTSSLALCSATFTNLPAGALNGLYVEFVPVSSLGTGTFTLTNAQFELGTIVTAFETKPRGIELAQCLRYFQQLGEIAGNFITTTAVRGSIRYFVPMRATPVLSAGTMQAEGVSNIAISSPSIANASYLTATFNGTVTGATAGQAARVVTTTGSSWLSAEL